MFRTRSIDQLIDDKGDEWRLTVPPVKHTNRNGLAEMWCIVETGPEELTKFYALIPVPIFTDWWE